MRILALLILGLSAHCAVAESRLKNISTNGPTGSNTLVSGFIIEGDVARTVVVTGEQFNSTIDPKIKVTDITGQTVFGANDDWRNTASVGAIVGIVGREPLQEIDAAVVLSLGPGVYLAHLEASPGQSGTGILAVNIETSDVGVARFAGVYEGTFKGGDQGDFTVTIHTDGRITGTGRAVLGGDFSVNGTASSSGNINLSTGDVSTGDASVGGLFRGSIAQSGGLTGIWASPRFGSGGTFEGVRN